MKRRFAKPFHAGIQGEETGFGRFEDTRHLRNGSGIGQIDVRAVSGRVWNRCGEENAQKTTRKKTKKNVAPKGEPQAARVQNRRDSGMAASKLTRPSPRKKFGE